MPCSRTSGSPSPRRNTVEAYLCCFRVKATLLLSRKSRSRRSLPQPGGFGRLLAHEIEVVPAGDPRLRAREDGQLARDAIELAGAAHHHEVVVARLEITLDPDMALAADPSVQANEPVALHLVSVLFPALKAVATDLAAAVVRIAELVLEDERVLAHLVKRLLLREHREVTVERERRGCDHGRPEHRESCGQDELTHLDSSLSVDVDGGAIRRPV